MESKEGQALPVASSVMDQIRKELAQKEKEIEATYLTATNRGAAKLSSVYSSSPWLQLTRWPDFFGSCPLTEAVKLAELPAIGSMHAILREILYAFDRTIEEARSSITKEKINVFDRHRINSFIRHRSSNRPIFTNLKEGTYRSYKGVWKRLICFVFRVAYLRQSPCLHHVFTDGQSSALDTLLSTARALLDKEQNNHGKSFLTSDELQNKLDRSCLDFCISLLDHSLKGNIYDSIVVGFLAVIGIDQENNCFREPINYTSQLSAFAKMAQMLVIQRAVVGAELKEVDFATDLLEEMQDRFMVYDSRSPINWVQKLRAYGSKVRDSTTALGHIIWSEDGQHLSYKNFELDLLSLRWFIRDQLELAHTQLEELLFAESNRVFTEEVVPMLDLRALKDDPTVKTPGWNFLQDKRNTQLHGYDTWLLDRICNHDWLQKRFFINRTTQPIQWKTKAVESYL
jgi:hypothetical protein